MPKPRKFFFVFFVFAILFLITSCTSKQKEENKNSEPEKIDLTFVVNSDTIDSVTKSYEVGTRLTEEMIFKDVFNETEPTKTNFTKGDWFLESNYQTKISFPMLITKKTSLYLQWKSDAKETSVSITFYDGNTILETKTVPLGQTVTPITAPIKTGYTFINWYEDPDFNTVFNFDTYKVTKNTNIYAKFEIKHFDIKFYDDDTLLDSIDGEYNSTIVRPTNLETKIGYTFINWYEDPDFNTVFNFDTYKVIKNTNIYAKFEIKHFDIKFYDDDTLLDSIDGEYNSTIVRPTNLETKIGYTFINWYEDPDFNTVFNFDTYKLTKNTNIYAKFIPDSLPPETDITITNSGGYNEGAFIEFNKLNTPLSNYEIYYGTSEANTKLDAQLIRENSTSIRADIVGIPAGTYRIAIKVKNTDITKTIDNIVVTKYDRSGYAHFKYTSGVGAYKDDGTPKDNAVIVYVNDSNKNTVTAKIGSKTYTGLANILQNQKGTVPLIIRVIGTINAATWNKINYTSGDPSNIKGLNGTVLSKKNYSETDIVNGGFNNFDNDIANGITKLNGLSNSIKWDSSKNEFDSYYNMLDVDSAKNVTIEGIGCDAMLYQWGFTWKKCSSIEVRNLTFDDYTEDACSFEGSDDSTTLEGFTTGHLWVHHNTFNEGKNNWDVCAEQDKHEGDGATDFKKNAYITLSYNHYYKNHKTGLIGGSDSQHTACVTFHHNYYENCNSRLPLGRQANMHMYNNYYYNSTGTNMSIRAGAFAFVENCVFEKCNNPMETKEGSGLRGVIKSYNNTVENCEGVNNETKVNTREEPVDNDNIYNQAFDTNVDVFYYDSNNKVSKVENLLPTNQVKEYVKNNAGSLKGSFSSGSTSSPDPTPSPNPNPEISESVVLTFNDFDVDSIEDFVTKGALTIYKGEKNVSIVSCDKEIASTTISKYVSLGGVGNYNSACIRFTTTKTANITVYYAGGADRHAALYDSTNSKTEAETPTIDTNTIVNYTFESISAGEYAVCSAGSGLSIYCIVIEYL